MNFDKQYQQKLCSAEQAVTLIPATAVISMGMRVAPPQLYVMLWLPVRKQVN